MPLCTGDEYHAWMDVRAQVKGKPAFSVRDPKPNGQSAGRPVRVFGVSKHLSLRDKNHERCHYIHYSSFGDSCLIKNFWYGVNFGERLNNILGEAPRNDHMFYSLVNSDNSVFKLSEEYIDDILKTWNLHPTNWAAAKVLCEGLFSFFSGCVDCNQQMTTTQFNENLYDMMFPLQAKAASSGAIAGAARGKGVNKKVKKPIMKEREVMMHYIMLSGALNKNEINKGVIQVKESHRVRSWSLRYIMMWCSLQILFCSWLIQDLDIQIKHHTSYIYYGTADFYVSLWFYAFHCLHVLPSSSGTALEIKEETKDKFMSEVYNDSFRNMDFEEFHFYYSTMLPFVKKRGNIVNLACWVFGDDFFNNKATKREKGNIQTSIKHIYEKMVNEWNANVYDTITQPFFSRSQQTPIGFTNFHSINPHREKYKDKPLTISEFEQLLKSPTHYWLHFKKITFARIKRDSAEYDTDMENFKRGNNDSKEVDAFIRLWRCWFRDFARTVGRLL